MNQTYLFFQKELNKYADQDKEIKKKQIMFFIGRHIKLDRSIRGDIKENLFKTIKEEIFGGMIKKEIIEKINRDKYKINKIKC